MRILLLSANPARHTSPSSCCQSCFCRVPGDIAYYSLVTYPEPDRISSVLRFIEEDLDHLESGHHPGKGTTPDR